MAKKARRKRYSSQEKRKILETARKEGLTGAQVRKRFGIAQLTFYRWRGPVRGKRKRTAAGRPAASKAGAAVGRPRAAGAGAGIRREVRAGIERVLPGVIREEVAAYLAEILGRGPGRPPGRKRGRKRGRPRGRKSPKS